MIVVTCAYTGNFMIVNPRKISFITPKGGSEDTVIIHLGARIRIEVTDTMADLEDKLCRK